MIRNGRFLHYSRNDIFGQPTEEINTMSIEIILRAIIIHKGKILLNYSQDKPPYYYLPGGHLEYGESIRQSLNREMKEEIGTGVKSMKFLTIAENFWKDKKGKKHHEINLLYFVKLSCKNPFALKSHESHVFITWLDIKKFPKFKLLPPVLHKYVIKYLNKV